MNRRSAANALSALAVLLLAAACDCPGGDCPSGGAKLDMPARKSAKRGASGSASDGGSWASSSHYSGPASYASSPGGAFRTIPASFDGGAEKIGLSGEPVAAPEPPQAAPRGPAPAADPSSSEHPTAGLRTFDFKPTGLPFIQDIRSRDPDTRAYSSIETAVHEGTHMINRQIRDARGSGNGIGLYLEDGKAAWFEEPALVKDDIHPHIPAFVKATSYRYQRYVVERQHAHYFWNLYDEWSAYINGNRALVEIAPSGRWRSSPSQTGTDVVDGTVEFMIFGFAMAAAIEQKDPGYFARQPGFKALVAHETERSMRWINAALDFREPNGNKPFAGFKSPGYLQSLRSSRDAAPMRELLKRWYGPAWTAKTLGF